MKLIDIKNWVNSLTEEELEQNLLYNSDEFCISGVVDKIICAKEDMYISGDCDPDPLKPKSYWVNECDYDADNLEEDMILEIPKGSYYINL